MSTFWCGALILHYCWSVIGGLKCEMIKTYQVWLLDLGRGVHSFFFFFISPGDNNKNKKISPTYALTHKHIHQQPCWWLIGDLWVDYKLQLYWNLNIYFVKQAPSSTVKMFSVRCRYGKQMKKKIQNKICVNIEMYGNHDQYLRTSAELNWKNLNTTSLNSLF